MIAKYRKKPVVISAVQWDSTNEAEVLAFVGDDAVMIGGDLAIRTLEGELHAACGDYIIRGVNGEFYPCKPGIFEQTYDQVAA